MGEASVADIHVRPQMLPPGDEGVDPHDVLEAEARVGEDRRYVVEGEFGLLAGGRGNVAAFGDPQLARAEDESLPGRNLDAVGIGREGRVDGGRRERLVHNGAQLTGKNARKPAQKRALLVLI